MSSTATISRTERQEDHPFLAIATAMGSEPSSVTISAPGHHPGSAAVIAAEKVQRSIGPMIPKVKEADDFAYLLDPTGLVDCLESPFVAGVVYFGVQADHCHLDHLLNIQN